MLQLKPFEGVGATLHRKEQDKRISVLSAVARWAQPCVRVLASLALLLYMCAPNFALADEAGNAGGADLEAVITGGESDDVLDDQLAAVDPADTDAPVEPSDPDTPVVRTYAPVITAPADTVLPAGTLGEKYVDADNKALTTFEADANPKASWMLGSKHNSSGSVTATATRRVDASKHVYWKGAGLPDGLELSQSTGELLGTPTDDGGTYPRTFSFTVVAFNDVAPDAQRTYSIKIKKAPEEQPEPETVTVPDVEGMNATAAKRALAKLGLTCKETKKTSEVVAEGKVISQQPAAGKAVDPGSQVSIVVSKGTGVEEPPKVVSLSLYAFSTNSSGAYVSRLGDNGRVNSDGEWWVPGGIKTKGGSIRLSAYVSLSDGSSFWQHESNWPSSIDLGYKSSSASIAAVTSKGVVTAAGDGTATLTATADGVSGQIKVKVVGQSDPYPEEVQVTDINGNDYGDERIKYSEITDESYTNLYARIVYSDGSTACNAPHAKDYVDPKGSSAKAKALAALRWSSSNTEKGYVGETSGLFKPKGYGSFKLYAQVESEGADKGYVKGYVWVLVDSGTYSTGEASNVLNVKVVYQLDEKTVVKTASYTVDQLRAIQSIESTYTYTSYKRDEVSGEEEYSWVTASARGIYLVTLLDELDIATKDLYAMRLAANDGVNPGLLTTDFLFAKRYYYPNYELATNTSGAELVFPMFAYESDLRSSAAGSYDCSKDYNALDDESRFRLMFGATGKKDGTQSKSLKYINTVTFILKGAPPAQPDVNGDEGGQDGSDAAVPGTRESTGTGSNNSGTQDGGGTAEDQLGGTGKSPQGAQSARGVRGSQPTVQAAAPATSQRSASDAAKQNSPADTTQKWHAYQMMQDSETMFEFPDWDNPWTWVCLVLMLLALLAAMSGRYVRFRYHTRVAG